jgi:hypothetical protein
MAEEREGEPAPYPPGTNMLASYLALMAAGDPNDVALVTANSRQRTAPGPQIVPTPQPPPTEETKPDAD